MSLVADFFRTGANSTSFTLWRLSEGDPTDPDDNGGWSRIGAFSCTYTTNPKLIKDADGRMFKPSIAIYTKYSGALRGDRMVIGDIANAEPTSDAREITHIMSAHPLLGTPDYDLFAE